MSMYEWNVICKAFCKKKGWELLFVNEDSLGCMKPDGTMLHIYADELELSLGG